MTAQPLLCRFRRGAWWLAALLLAAGCSGPYTRQQAVPPQYRLTVPEGIRVAAQAMQTVGYFPVKQDVGAGYIVGEQKRKDSFGLDMFSLSLSVSFLPAGEGRLNMSATAAVSENIANVSTTGYKRTRTEFHTLVGSTAAAPFYTGGVGTTWQSLNSEQGTLLQTGRTADLAIRGRGYFVVESASGQPGLTRAGAFTPDDNGRLVNAAGQYLLGYPAGASPLANGVGGLQRIDVVQTALSAAPSVSGFLSANLNSDAAITPAANLPSANAATSASTSKTSLLAYDNLGHRVTLDVHLTKTAANTWEVAIFDAALV